VVACGLQVRWLLLDVFPGDRDPVSP